MTGKIIAICGKICSGKTYYANAIRQQENAVILSCDEVTKALFDNDLGDRHDEMTLRIRTYLRNKAAELAEAGCTVILDWGFWTKESRENLSAFCRTRSIPCQWHYIHVDDAVWHQHIHQRNARILQGQSGSDYYLDDGLLCKLLSLWEEPNREEIDIWCSQ